MSKSSKILVPTDFSERSAYAVQQGVNLARIMDAEVVLAHVVEESAMSFLFGSIDVQDLKQSVKTKLEAQAEKITADTSLPSSVRVRTGKPYKKLVEIISEEGINLVVMGMNNTEGTGGFIGSTAARLIKTSPCPVITINNDSHKQGCHRIVVPLDLSKETTEKVDTAIATAQRYRAEVNIVSVIEGSGGFEYEALSNLMRNELLKFKKHEIPATAEFVQIIKSEDTVASAIVAYSKKVDADLIVVMTQQEGGIKELFIGSAARELIRNSEIPVMSVQPAGAEVAV